MSEHTPVTPSVHDPLLSRRAAIGALGAAGLSAAAIAQIGQPPSSPTPPAQPAATPTPPATVPPPTPKPSPVGPAAVTAGTDLNGCGFYRFKVGTTTLTLLTDGTMPLSLAMFGGPGNASKEDVTAAAADVLIPPAKLLGHVHGLLIDTGKGDQGRVLVDTGCGGGMGPHTGRLPRALALAGITPAQIGAVVITHAHPDHVGGLMEASGPNLFANAQFYAAKAEVEFWTVGAAPDLSRSRLDIRMKDAVTMTARTLFEQLQESATSRPASIRSATATRSGGGDGVTLQPRARPHAGTQRDHGDQRGGQVRLPHRPGAPRGCAVPAPRLARRLRRRPGAGGQDAARPADPVRGGEDAGEREPPAVPGGRVCEAGGVGVPVGAAGLGVVRPRVCGERGAHRRAVQ